MNADELRSVQAPFKEHYREDPDAALTGNLSAVARHILHQYKHQLIGH